MKDIISYYHTCFNKERQKAISHLKKKLVIDKKNHYPFLRSHNELINEFIDIKKNSIPKLAEYSELFSIFENRCSYFDEEHQYQILLKEIEPLFIKIESTVTFNEFVSDLAKIEAYHDIINLFRNYSQIYQMMYELNKFDGYENMEKFDVLRYIHKPEGTKIFKELRYILYPSEISEQHINHLDEINNKPHSDEKIKNKKNSLKLDNLTNSKDTHIDGFREKINFNINIKYKSNFKNLYYHLTDYFDEDVISSDCFENVFLKETSLHNDEIIFNCDTNVAAYLLIKLGKSLFKNLTQTNIEKSKKFKSMDEVCFSQSTLSRCHKRINLEEQKNIDKLIRDFKKQTLIY